MMRSQGVIMSEIKRLRASAGRPVTFEDGLRESVVLANDHPGTMIVVVYRDGHHVGAALNLERVLTEPWTNKWRFKAYLQTWDSDNNCRILNIPTSRVDRCMGYHIDIVLGYADALASLTQHDLQMLHYRTGRGRIARREG